MSTKTTFKRIALVTVAALGFGVLTSVAPATALPAKSIALNTSSMTIVQNAAETPIAVVRIDVASTDGNGLGNNETITAEVTGVPSGVVAKTLNGHGGLFSAANNDLRMVEVTGQTANLASVWNRYTPLTPGAGVNFADTTTAGDANAADGKIDRFNTKYAGMDGNDTTTAGTATTDTPTLQSHYVAIFPKSGASVIDFGVYTISFTLTDAQGNQLGTVQTLKLDFVSTAVRSGAVLALTTAGTFTTTETVGSTTAKNATLTIRNRDAGVIRSGYGAPVTPTMSLLDSLGRVVTAAGSGTAVLVALDNGDDGSAGTHNTDSGTGLYNGNNGTFGVTWDAARYTWDADGNTIRAAYGSAVATAAITTFVAATGYTSSASITATGKVDTSATAATLPLTTKAASVTVRVLNGAVAVQDYPVRFTTTWSGSPAGDVSPVTGTTGSTLVRTNSSGLATLSLTHANPADAASASVAIFVGGATTATITEVLTWSKSKPAAVLVDPAGPMTVALKSANKVTFTVLDTFSKPVVGEVMALTVTGSNNTTASPLLIPSATTDANGQVSYTLTDALAVAAGTDTIRATTTSLASNINGALTLTYATTVPVASSMKVYYDASETTWSTLVPVTTIYRTSTTGFSLNQAKDITASLIPSPKSGTDDVVGFNATVLTSALAGASGLPVTVSISDGGWILNSAGLPVKSRVYYTSSTGVTGLINVTATTPGVKTLTFTVGTVSSTAAVAFTNELDGSTGRFVTVTAGAKNASAKANATSLPSFTAKVTDNLGNPVAGAALNIVTTGVARLATGGKTAQWTTDASGEYVFELTSSDAGAATVTVTATTAGQFSDPANFIGAAEVVGTKAGVRTATGTVTFAEGNSAATDSATAATDAATAAADAAAEATDAANAATDAANAAAEAADAATAAAQDAADAVAALSTQVSEMIDALKKQITALTNLVIKIQKKVKA